MHHAIGCGSLRGHNRASRHSAAKDALAYVCKCATVPIEEVEPRLSFYECPGCKVEFHGDDWARHRSSCPLLDAAKLCTVHSRGPDVTYYVPVLDDRGRRVPGPSTVADLTVISTAAPGK